MPPSAYLTHEIDRGPAGPKIGALFDLDGTLLAGFSVLALLRDRLLDGALSAQDVADSALSALAFRRGSLGFAGLLGAMARVVRGASEREFEQLCERFYQRSLVGLVYPEARAMVRAHRQRGHTLAVVSAATRYQVAPVARDLGIEHVLCSALEVRQGRFTGRVLDPTLWGAGKLDAALRFAKQHELDLAQSWFYSDGAEDLPLLEAVGRPRPLNPEPELARVALERGWPVRHFTSRPAARWTDALRTLALVASAPGPALLSMAAVPLQRTRLLLRASARLWGRLGSALAGVRLRVEGREHLALPGPAVFVFNHQSAIDPLVLCRLLPGPFAWLVPERPGSSSLLRRLAAPVDTVFLGTRGSAGAMEPALSRLRDGVSLVAPHQPGGPHARYQALDDLPLAVAAAAGVPLAALALHNAQAALPTNALVVRPAAIDVQVFAPLQTRSWTPASLPHHVEALHALYGEVLST